MRIRRRRAPATAPAAAVAGAAAAAASSGSPGEEDAAAAAPARAPFEVTDVEAAEGYIDLGGMVIGGAEGLELRLEVDQTSGTVSTVLLVGDDGVMEVRAVAAARGGDAWATVRAEIATEVEQRGGSATEARGPLGVELHCQTPVTMPTGETVQQPTRILGHLGARWMVRATLAGPAATDPARAVRYERALGRVGVRRGGEAMPPGQGLPLRLPQD